MSRPPSDGLERAALSDRDFQRLAAWRYALRRFLGFSECAARRAGLSPSQHQLLLCVRGFPKGQPTVADLAEHLQIRHHSVVGLLDRCERAGLVRRRDHPQDRRRVLVSLTPRGRRVLQSLTLVHLRELASLAPAFPVGAPLLSTLGAPSPIGREQGAAE